MLVVMCFMCYYIRVVLVHCVPHIWLPADTIYTQFIYTLNYRFCWQAERFKNSTELFLILCSATLISGSLLQNNDR